MPIIKYIDAAGAEYETEVDLGSTVMKGAVDNMLEGILAECGGACACATCHCYVDEAWRNTVGEPSDVEKDLLTVVAEPKPNSRLSCQIVVTEAMDGLVVHMPESQY